MCCYRYLIMTVYVLLSAQVLATPVNVIYPDREGMDEDTHYPIALLKLALKNSGEPYKISKSTAVMNDARIRSQLSAGNISVAWFGTSKDFESLFLPVRIPVTRSTLGYRLFIIHKDNEQAFKNIKSLEQLKKFTAGQGLGWADINILEHSGLSVYSTNLENIYTMIARKRIDYLPLGANEVFGMLDGKSDKFPELMVETSIVLIYPFDFLFFVNKTNIRLHEMITKGLLNSIESGSYEKLFLQHPDNKQFVEKANIESRKQFRIENPLITRETAEALKKYSY